VISSVKLQLQFSDAIVTYKPSLEMALSLQIVEHCSQEVQSLCTSIYKNRRPFKWCVHCKARHVKWKIWNTIRKDLETGLQTVQNIETW